MTIQRILSILLALVSAVCSNPTQTSINLKLLHNELFNTRSYQKVIPSRESLANPTVIDVAFFLHGITSVDDVEGKVTSTAHLRLEWTDAFLTWNATDYGNITYIYMPQNEVWKPDVSLNNGFTKLKELGDNVFLVKIHYSGRIEWNPFDVFETRCDIKIKRFPFDHQKCKLVFRMWTSVAEDVKFELSDSVLNLVAFEPNAVWDLRSSKLELDRGNFIVVLELYRRPEYYLLTLICPIILLSLLATLTFVIPVDSGEKMGYSMTVFLAFAVLMTILSSSLPVNSRTTSYLAVYLIGLLSKGTLIVMVTAAQIRLHHRQDNFNLHPKLRSVITIIKRLQTCIGYGRKANKVTVSQITSSQTENSENTARVSPQLLEAHKNSQIRHSLESSSNDNDDGAEMYTWADFSAALDFYGFCFFNTVGIIFAIFFFTAAAL